MANICLSLCVFNRLEMGRKVFNMENRKKSVADECDGMRSTHIICGPQRGRGGGVLAGSRQSCGAGHVGQQEVALYNIVVFFLSFFSLSFWPFSLSL